MYFTLFLIALGVLPQKIERFGIFYRLLTFFRNGVRGVTSENWSESFFSFGLFHRLFTVIFLIKVSGGGGVCENCSESLMRVCLYFISYLPSYLKY